jgi:hypothetical protein
MGHGKASAECIVLVARGFVHAYYCRLFECLVLLERGLYWTVDMGLLYSVECTP